MQKTLQPVAITHKASHSQVDILLTTKDLEALSQKTIAYLARHLEQTIEVIQELLTKAQADPLIAEMVLSELQNPVHVRPKTTRVRATHCKRCGSPIPPRAKQGRPRKFCNRSCKERWFNGKRQNTEKTSVRGGIL